MHDYRKLEHQAGECVSYSKAQTKGRAKANYALGRNEAISRR